MSPEIIKRIQRGPMSDSAPDYVGLYAKELQGDFYGADYYRPPLCEIDSAIIYDDGEDKRTVASFIAMNFAPRRVLEAGCAMGLLVKSLRGLGVDAEGFDFSKWCIENAPPDVRPWIRREDVLDLKQPADGYEMVLALDILEHLPPEKIPQALKNLAAVLTPGGILFAVIPAYGPNAFGPELYALQYEEWRRDAALGIPFRNIPLDDRGRPHLGHLTHATVGWWEQAFRRAGLRRMGKVERLLHQRYDERLEFSRRSFFVYVKSGSWGSRKIRRRLLKRIQAVPGLASGFWGWERWGEDLWMRWTKKEAWDPLEVRDRAELDLRAICNHPDIASSPVQVSFRIDEGEPEILDFNNHDWHSLSLKLPCRQFAGLEVKCSRTWVPKQEAPEGLQRELGVGISYSRVR